MDSGLKDRVVVVTGASGGIGTACAQAFAEEGARIVLHANSNLAAAEALSLKLDCETLVVQADLRIEAEVQGMFVKIAEDFGAIDSFVANAGIWPPDDTHITDMSLEQWQNTIATDLTSVFLCAREFFRSLKSAQTETGNLVMIGSTAAVFGEAGHCDYSAAKAAMTYGLNQTLKNEIAFVARKGRVNTVCPGWTLTPMAEKKLEDAEGVARVLQTRSMRQVASGEDIARAVVFLASDRLAGHISGQAITVSGGMEGRLLWDRDEVDPANAIHRS